MQVILLETIENIGTAGETVIVKNGFGRNYLIPKKMAVIANRTNKALAQEKLKQKAAQKAKMLEDYKAIADKLAASVVRVGAKAGTTDKIFGSVTNVQLSNEIKEQLGIDIDRKKITIEEEVKTLGTYSAKIDLHPEVPCSVNFEVYAE